MQLGGRRRGWLGYFPQRTADPRAVRLLTVLMLSVASVLAFAQSDEVPRTPWGAPDLQGVWFLDTLTPLERPSGFEHLPRVTGAEAEAFLQQLRDANHRVNDALLSADFYYGSAGAANEIRGRALLDGRTSLVVEPPDGQIPRTPLGRQRANASRAKFGAVAAGPEDRPLQERCITMFAVPLGPLGSPFSLPVLMLQTPNHVVFYQEQFHDAVIAPLGSRVPLPETIQQWHGDSRAFWEEDTLVVESRNFDARWTFQGSGAELRLVQRFRRVNAETADYSYTVYDPEAFTQPWTVEFPLTFTDAPLYEYACHEGNRSMAMTLSGARAQEAKKTRPQQ